MLSDVALYSLFAFALQAFFLLAAGLLIGSFLTRRRLERHYQSILRRLIAERRDPGELNRLLRELAQVEELRRR